MSLEGNGAMKKNLVLLLGVFVAVAMVSFWTPYMGDDYIWLFANYGDSLPAGEGPANGSVFFVGGVFSRVIDMVWTHYLSLNGRILSNFISGLFGAMSVFEYACFNAVVFVLFLYLFWKKTGLSMSWRFLVVFSLVIFLIDDEAVFWRSATSNYLWPAMITLAFCELFARQTGPIRALRGGVLAILAFIVAGGHEIIDFGVCAALAVYLFLYLIRNRRLPFDGRMAMSIGFVLGSFSLVFAPGTLQRARDAGMFAPNGSVLYSIAAFARAWIRCVMACPLIVVIIGYLIWAVLGRKWNLIGGRRYSYPLLSWVVMLFFTCFLTDGVGRTSWLLSACSLLVFFMILREYEHRISSWLIFVLNGLLGGLAIGVVVLSSWQSYAAKCAYDDMLEKWRNEADGLFVGRQWMLPRGLGWFDRTLRLDGLLHYGSGYPNHLVARAYKRKNLIRVTEEMCRTLRDPEGILSEGCRIDGGAAIHSVDNVDLIAIPYSGSLAHGAPIQASIAYHKCPSLSFSERVRLRVTREGSTAACPNSPLEDMSGNQLQKGFICESSERRKFAVVILNHRIPREAIAGVQISQCRMPLRELVLVR